jgi:hypothetical protein
MTRLCWTFMVIGLIGLVLGVMGDRFLGAYGVTLVGASLIGLCILNRKG